MMQESSNNRYIIDPKKRMRLLYKKTFFSYLKKYGITISVLWLLSFLTNIFFDLSIPLVYILFVIGFLAFFDLEYDIGLLLSENLFYNDKRIIKTKYGDLQVPNSLYLLAIPFLNDIVKYIEETRINNTLFKVSLDNVILKNNNSKKNQEIVFYACSFCTRIILDINTQSIIVSDDFITFDVGFISGLRYIASVQDNEGNTLDKMPQYKIQCIKEAISKKILEEDIDNFCYNNRISTYDFLTSFFFVYWLVENYLLHSPNRKVLI